MHMRHSIALKYLSLSLCLLAILGMVACGKDADKKVSTQVAAKVDGEEISMHQINLLMKGAQNVTPENAASVRQQLLEKLIDQQIIVEKANKENLDRTPDVMMAIEAAKKDILARAYLQKLVANSLKVTDQEIKSYYAEHTGLFAKRRIYNLQDLGVEKAPEIVGLLNDDVVKQKSIPELAELLKSKGIKYSAGSYTRPAEQLPLDILPKLQDLREGESAVFEVQNSVHVIRVIKAQDAPMDIAAAAPFIKNYFLNTRGKQIVEDEMKKFRQQAKIEYVGDFAGQSNKSGQASQEAPTVNVTKPENKDTKNSAIEAGVAGLK